LGLPWVRLDTALPRNSKVVAVLAERDGHRAAFLYICSLAYCGEQGSDGYIPKGVLPLIHGRPKDAALLVRHRLWHEENGGIGWFVNGWAEFQPSSAETQERARKARQAALKANCTRWHEPGCMCWKEST
jgi:hypothetical protein